MQEHSESSYVEQEDKLSSSDSCQANYKVQSFYSCLNRLKIFSDNLPSTKVQEYSDQVLKYCGKADQLSKAPQEIFRLCEKRIQKMLRNKKTKKNWNTGDIGILIWLVDKYVSHHQKKSIKQMDEKDWKFISELIPATSWKRCMFKWLSLKKFSLLVHRWTSVESDLLVDLIKQHGKSDWKKLSQKLFSSNQSSDKVFRTPKQCRQHWNCYLNPTIHKGPWSDKEDAKLLECILELNCQKRWSQIAKSIKGRTQNAVKNRYILLIQKQKKITGQQSEKQVIHRMLLNFMQSKEYGRIQIKPEKDDQIEAQGLNSAKIFQEDQGRQQKVPQQKNMYNQKRAAQSFRHQNSAAQNETSITTSHKVTIPTIISHPTNLVPGNFYPTSHQIHQYFFGMMYGNPFMMQ